MIGLEPAEPSIQVAKQHAARDPILRDRLTYECTTVEEYVGRTDLQQVDLVVASEVIEHVANPPLFTHNICKLIKVPYKGIDEPERFLCVDVYMYSLMEAAERKLVHCQQ